MTKRKDLLEPAGTHSGKTESGLSSARSGNGVTALPGADQAAGGFPIVGIGASAGGLAAFDAFSSLSGAGADSGSPMLARFGISRPLREAAEAVIVLTCAALDVTGQQGAAPRQGIKERKRYE